MTTADGVELFWRDTQNVKQDRLRDCQLWEDCEQCFGSAQLSQSDFISYDVQRRQQFAAEPHR
jgi:hypothetical protein